MTDAVEAGAGLPEILRAAARALGASLILIDRSASVLAVAARSPADERSLMRDADDVTTIELKVAEATVGHLRMRSREHTPDASLLRLVTTLIASEAQRLPGFAFAIGRSRHATNPLDLHRAGNEALLAVNVVEGDAEMTELAFEATGTYQLLLPHMNDPAELKRFYDDTVRPLVAYDEQYETDLLGTLATFLECDANVNATAARLITHRHTIRYRFERVRELTGLDVSSTDGREKLSLGLKAMRVMGIAAPRGPATEPGAEGGRVRR